MDNFTCAYGCNVKYVLVCYKNLSVHGVLEHIILTR